jgi:hypothetical protein
MSEVKVNKISPRTNCGTVTLGDSGDSFAIATCASFKTKDVKDTSGNIIISRCGSNITIGSSGAAVALAAGATQSGFGRTGTVNWDTTAKTASFTAVSGEGYFVNTTSGAITVTLPAGSAGAIVSLADYTNTWQTNNVTVTPDGSEKIGGIASSATLNTEGQSVTFVYVDATEGWKNVQDSTSNVTGSPFIAATGGTVTCCGDYKIHTFTGPGTFTVTNAGSPTGSTTVDYMVVAGGGAGGDGAGGGGGGFRESVPSPAAWTASPLANPGGALPVSVQGYPIVVGAGGAVTPDGTNGGSGVDSVFSTITSTGGGGGAKWGTPRAGSTGGSGGGGSGTDCGTGTGGAGNTPPTSPPQGTSGGNSPSMPGTQWGAAGGGGATGTGGNPPGSGVGGVGGAGATSSINGTPTARAGGGGGGSYVLFGGGSGGSGGTGGGGNGGFSGGQSTTGSINTGGGGGGAGNNPGGNTNPKANTGGGSGIVVIRYKYQ